jgi:hypothetical protein
MKIAGMVELLDMNHRDIVRQTRTPLAISIGCDVPHIDHDKTCPWVASQKFGVDGCFIKTCHRTRSQTQSADGHDHVAGLEPCLLSGVRFTLGRISK